MTRQLQLFTDYLMVNIDWFNQIELVNGTNQLTLFNG